MSGLRWGTNWGRGPSVRTADLPSVFKGVIYKAYDNNLKKHVALKIEKKDKNKHILVFEF